MGTNSRVVVCVVRYQVVLEVWEKRALFLVVDLREKHITGGFDDVTQGMLSEVQKINLNHFSINSTRGYT